MACRVAGPHCPVFLPTGVCERMRWRETPNKIQELKGAIRVGISTINQELLLLVFDNFVSDYDRFLQMKQATFKMLSVKSNK